MASYRAVNGVLLSLEHFFKTRMPAALKDGPVSAKVQLLGSAGLEEGLSGNALALYLHRVALDPHGRSRFFTAQGLDKNTAPTAELPVNLHVLLMVAGVSAAIEADLLAWAMIALANESQFDIAHLQEFDDGWTEREVLTITPDDMPNEDLLRLRDALGVPYGLSVPYMVRTLRLRLKEPQVDGPAVISRVFPTGIAEA